MTKKKLQTGRIQTFLSGKIFQYYLNAYTDAKIAKELNFHLKAKNKTNLSKRSLQIAKMAKGNSKMISGISYAMYYWNGFYDYMWAKFWEKFLPKDTKDILQTEVKSFQKKTSTQSAYAEFGGKIILAKPIFLLFLGKLHFAKRSRKLIEAVILTQKHNIKSNQRYIKLLLKGKAANNEKIKSAFACSEKFKNNEIFIKGCIHTLNGASFWDGLFIKILRIRFKN